MIKTRQELIERPIDLRPHVVLLGAGASRAALPKGDAAGRRLPLMNDLVEIVGLQSLIERAGQEQAEDGNFEAIYGRLINEPTHEHIAREIERKMDAYFASLSLPKQATIYDKLLLSLRSTDAVFTFNWDPLLFDAYQRNQDAVPLPEIFFLHGNVRVGACPEHDTWGVRKGRCPVCLNSLVDVPLLYPIVEKNYSDNPYIQRNWDAAEDLFREAFTLTIFGYSAPASDRDALDLLRLAWTGRSDRALEHIEVVDNADQSVLHDRWSPFAPTLHYRTSKTFEGSRLARWPRRSCESLIYPMSQGIPCEDFPLPGTDNLAELQGFAAEIARHEKAIG